MRVPPHYYFAARFHIPDECGVRTLFVTPISGLIFRHTFLLMVFPVCSRAIISIFAADQWMRVSLVTHSVVALLVLLFVWWMERRIRRNYRDGEVFYFYFFLLFIAKDYSF